MGSKGSFLLCLCTAMVQLLQLATCLPPSALDPEIRAHLEAKVMSSMSLRDLEDMVERDERVLNAPQSRIIIVPKGAEQDPDPKAYVIHRKQKKYPKKVISENEGFGLAESVFDNGRHFRSSAYAPKFRYESAFKLDEKFPSLFSIGDMEPAASDPVKSFYEAIVERVVAENREQPLRDGMAVLEAAASDGQLAYRPRFDYDSYSRDAMEGKPKGKSYWKSSPERRDEKAKDDGCRTVVKKIMDPEDEKKSGKAVPKGVVITKECEYPTLEGPDAKIASVHSDLDVESTRYDSEPPLSFDGDVIPSSYDSSRPTELDSEPAPKTKDPLAPDYIDRMLDSHFRSFPTFGSPVSSFKGYQDRFKLRIPSAFKDVKPTVSVQSYDYSNPESGFSGGTEREVLSDSTSYRDESPASYDSQKRDIDYSDSALPKSYDHKYRFEYPGAKTEADAVDSEPQKNSKLPEKKPKMLKKSFAYYRKDNPKQDPNDQHYAEEYAQGNFRSISSSYDSDKDGAKKN